MNPGIWVVLGAFWVIAAFPAAVVIGRRLSRRAAREPVTLTRDQAERLWQAVQRPEAAVVAYCPDCEGELQDEAFEFWCPTCEAAVSYARVAAEGA